MKTHFSSHPKGHFFLKSGIRLFSAKEGGIILQQDPLRIIRINSAAYHILNACENGFSLTEAQQSILGFLDTLCQADILEWIPPDDPFTPLVSIIIPVYNRVHEIGDCIESLLGLAYPASASEIIVIDDASQDNTIEKIRQYPVKLICQQENKGQSAARNLGVQAATGDIIAFIDSDCIADPQWLQELIPYFHDPRNVLIGGYVDAFYQESWLDRYEAVHSPLNMGKKTIIGMGKDSVFYVPTCNLLIRKAAYLDVGGLDESMRVGEDVDLCWRLKNAGHRLMYVPKGRVKHKHRNRFFESFKRRYDYGTSEALLYAKYPETKKRFPWQAGGMLFFLFCCIGLVTHPVLSFICAGLVLIAESVCKMFQIKRFGISLSLIHILKATLRSHFFLIHYLTSHIIRYYLLLILPMTLLLPQIAPLSLALLLLPTVTEFYQRSPRLTFPIFLFFFWAEQAFYQTGAIRNCFKTRNFRLYRISFVHAGFLKGAPTLFSKIQKQIQRVIFGRH